MANKSNNARIGVVLVCLGFCFALGFFAGKKSARPIQIIQTSAAPVTVVTNIVTVVQKSSAGETNSSLPAAGTWSEPEWQRLLGQAATPDRNVKLADLLEKLAAVDPVRAMALAQGQTNLILRNELTLSALHGWARKSPMDAANWTMSLADSGDRDAALSSVFAGAIAADPDAAVAAGQKLMQQYPGDAISCGSRLIDALCDSGNFSVAAGLAVNGSSDQRNSWLGEAFSKWASFQPDAAAQAVQAITDPQLRNEALQGIVGGWAEADPAGLAQYLGQLPSGNERAQMLGQALKSWVQTDPAAAATWMNDNSNLGPDLDQGAAQVATMESVPTDIAVGMAESISDPRLRSATLASVLRDWAYNNLPAAENYLQTTTDLTSADRQQVSEVITDLARISPAQ
jgi:hypothetical protein